MTLSFCSLQNNAFGRRVLTAKPQAARRQSAAPIAAHPARPAVDFEDAGRAAGSAIKGLALSVALVMAPATAVTPFAVAAEDSTACMKKCTKECNKIAPGSPGYCKETCEDECAFMASEGISAEEADGKAKVTNLGFLGGDYEGNAVDNTLKQIFAGGKIGPPK